MIPDYSKSKIRAFAEFNSGFIWPYGYDVMPTAFQIERDLLRIYTRNIWLETDDDITIIK